MVLLAKGLPRDRFRVEVAALTRLGPLEGELGRGGDLRHLDRQAAQGRPAGAGAARPVPPREAVRRDPDLDLRRRHLRPGRGAAGGGPGGGDGGDGRRPLEGAVRTRRRPLPRRGGPTGWWGTRRRWSTSIAQVGIPAAKLADDPLGDRRRRAARPPSTRAPSGASWGCRPTARWPSSSAGSPSRRGSPTCCPALDLLQHVRPDLRTLIVGDGPLRGRLEATARSFELVDARRALFLGHRSDVPRLLAASDLLVLPSLYEGLPNVVLEAMRFRKPVVATAAPGTTEVVQDDVDRPARPAPEPPGPRPGDPPGHRRPRARRPAGRSGASPGRGRVRRRPDGRPLRRPLRDACASEGDPTPLIRQAW